MTSRTLVLPDQISGTGNWDNWVDHFESVTAVNGRDSEKRSLSPRPTSGSHFILTGKMGLVHIQRNLGSTAKYTVQISRDNHAEYVRVYCRELMLLLQRQRKKTKYA